MIQAAVFDMDGLLIDSEPLWQDAEMEVFGELGVPLTREMCLQTMGLRVDQVVEHWKGRFSWDGPTNKEVEARIVRRLIGHVRERGTAMPGAHEAVALFSRRSVPLAIASSSATEIVDAVLRKLDLQGRFHAIHSAEHEPFGKPHPGVYISAARKLDVAPETCLAFEDSINGVIAAKAARMKCVAVPDAGMRGDERLRIADITLDSLLAFDEATLETLVR